MSLPTPLKRTFFPAWISIAAVWFSMHAGGGFASGRQESNFYTQYGWTAIIMPMVAMILLGAVNYYAWNYARLSKSFDLRTFVDRFYQPYDKVFANIIDVSFVIFLCLPAGAAIAGAAQLMTDIFHIEYFMGTIFCCIILFFFTVFGAGLVRSTSTVMSIILLSALGVIVYFGIKSTSGQALEVIKNQTMADGATYVGVLWQAILYGSLQASIGTLITVAEPLRNRKDVFKTAICGICVNGFALVFICFMLLGSYPEIDKEVIPVLKIVENLDKGYLKWLYSITLFFAFLSTALVFIFASIRRFERAKVWSRCSDESIFKRRFQTRGMVIAIITMLYAWGASQFGLVAIVGKGYKVMAITNLILIVIPILIFGPGKCRRLEAAQKDEQ